MVPFSRGSVSPIMCQTLAEILYHVTADRMSGIKIQVFWDVRLCHQVCNSEV
jgi:hypothetical protein